MADITKKELEIIFQKIIEEIDKVEDKIMVGEYVVNFDTMGGVTDSIGVGCITVDKELFLKIAKRAGWK